jgi:flagellar M-ring protein FliF
MLDRVKHAAQRGVDGFRAFSPGQKAVTIVAVLTLAIGGYFFAHWASQPTLSPLFSNLSSTDASAIVDKLSASNVKYTLADGGQTIMVPKDQVYALRLQMAGQGLPAGDDTGYALLDKQGVTTSEFMQHVSYQRALEGELANTIRSIDGVNAATVHLALPQKDVFSDDQQKPTASVLVKTSTGKSLTDNQVQAIINLVSSSVEGMDATGVTLANADGTVLSKGGETTSAGGGDTQGKQTETFEQDMEDSLRGLLEQVVGKGHAAVTVTANLDYDDTQTKTQSYSSDPNAAPLAESKKSETYTGNGNAVGGVLGPDNIQVPSGTGSSPGANSYANTPDTKNNAVNSVTETRQAAPGSIKRLGIAVLLDSNVAASANTAKIQSLVQSAAALDSTRGDTLAVSSLPFDTSAATAAAKELAASQAATNQAQLMSTIKNGAAIGVIALLMIIAAIASRRNRKKQQRTVLTTAERLQLEEMQAALARERQRELDAANGQLALESGLPIGPDLAARQKDIAEMIERQPEEVAQLLRSWLSDRREPAGR